MRMASSFISTNSFNSSEEFVDRSAEVLAFLVGPLLLAF